jgi:outer membrane protein
MKKVSLVINVVLIVAVAVLYVFHFSSKSPKEEITKDTPTEAEKVQAMEELPIAYVQIDSLLANMEMYVDITEKLNDKQQKLESSFTSQYQSFEKEVVDFQTKVQKGLLTRREAQELEAGLGNKQAELENQRNSYLAELQEEGMVGQNKVINYIMEYLKEYNSDQKYKYIFSYSFGSALLYVNDASDITAEVLEGMNKKYAEETK